MFSFLHLFHFYNNSIADYSLLFFSCLHVWHKYKNTLLYFAVFLLDMEIESYFKYNDK